MFHPLDVVRLKGAKLVGYVVHCRPDGHVEVMLDSGEWLAIRPDFLEAYSGPLANFSVSPAVRAHRADSCSL